MQRHQGKLLFAASDIFHFAGCPHRTTLDLINLETPLEKTTDDEYAVLIQQKGHEHEHRYLRRLKEEGRLVAEIPDTWQIDEPAARTVEAMRSGADVIYQAVLFDVPWFGKADFFFQVDTPSDLGDYSYEVADTKLARKAKPYFLIQLCFYSELLGRVQGHLPEACHVILGDGSEKSFRVSDYLYYFRNLLGRFQGFIEPGRVETTPEPCSACEHCPWSERCQAQWVAEDHLSQVANIQRQQIFKLRVAGIETLEVLARAPETPVPPRMVRDTFDKIRRQAALQLLARETGKDETLLLPLDPDGRRGFYRLPEPAFGDLFFDMEGDPLHPDGLEYLFGIYFEEDGKPVYRAFWAHDRAEEKQSFEVFVDFLSDHLARHPDAHIYHYASYEETALKKLMSLHGTREVAIDNLLRSGKLVDLYKVVREAMQVSRPSYSIKELEAFYMEERGAEVTSGGDSVVFYEKWQETSEPALLESIRAYNEEDCRSTALLRDWLLRQRPADLPWLRHDDGAEEPASITDLNDAERRYMEYEADLIGNGAGSGNTMRELTAQLLEFHRREQKPEWWAMFSRRDASVEDLIEDGECLGGLKADPERLPEQDKRSLVFTHWFPEQETKLKSGDTCQVASSLDRAGKIVELDEFRCCVRIKRGMASGLLPESLSIIPNPPINKKVLRDAIYRFADSVIAGDARYSAVKDFLEHKEPRISGRSPGTPIITDEQTLLAQTIAAVEGLEDSHVYIQGPPGSGKTFTGGKIILELIRHGKKVGVTSNSHKAINNLLSSLEMHAAQEGFEFRGYKKTGMNPETHLQGTCIEDVNDYDMILGDEETLVVGGTAWLFARSEFDEAFDYLFVDEAGQVSAANLVAMGLAARNIVLLGDQMQLSQPSKGTHPGQSGRSVLEFLLDDQATIPPERGVFLGTTWRMHEGVCRFISDAIYDGRLNPEDKNANQRICLNKEAHPALQPTGISFVGVEHAGCTQRSEEEAAVVREIFESLLEQGFRDRDGNEHAMTIDDILVVAPYNMQVNLLTNTLPAGARVGTVDKFQGQEAPVVIVSLATSSGQDMPRNVEFLLSKNRLNVAISRARSLAIMVASPKLTEISCSKVEQMELVNLLCWLQEFALKATVSDHFTRHTGN
jgi:predicted RecB family nuclease